MLPFYKGKDRMNAITALILAENLEKQPQRWRREFIWIMRDDGFRIAAFVPYENTVLNPRWVEKDVFGEERIVIAPRLASWLLTREIKRWMKKAQARIAYSDMTSADINSGICNRLGIDFSRAA